jgi:hypothetical protein
MTSLFAALDPDPQQAFYGVIFLVFAGVLGVALIVSLLGILSMTLVVAPNATQRCAAALRERNVRSFFAGLPVLGVFGISAAATHRTPELLSVVALTFSVALVLAFAAAAEDIGRRLFWSCGKEGSRASHLAVGWLVFAFGSLFPVLGWFLILPWVSVSGLGSLLVGALRSAPAAGAPPAAPKDVEFISGNRE